MDTAAAPRSESSALTGVVDPRRGTVRVSGDLTVQGADLLRGTVECLRRDGHDVVLLDLRHVTTVDPGGLQELAALERAVADEGGELLVLSPPAIPAPRC